MSRPVRRRDSYKRNIYCLQPDDLRYSDCCSLGFADGEESEITTIGDLRCGLCENFSVLSNVESNVLEANSNARGVLASVARLGYLIPQAGH